MSHSNGDSNKSEFRLKDAPDDGISSVRFGPNSGQFLLVSSWDKNVRLYDVQSNNLRVKYAHQRPVLSCAFQDPIHVWSGCLDGKLKSFDINSNQETVVGQHESTIRCIEYSNDINAVSFSFSCDKKGNFKKTPHSLQFIGGDRQLGLHRENLGSSKFILYRNLLST